MSFDHLQAKIKTQKCPIAVTIAPPDHGEFPAIQTFCWESLTAAKNLVPAVRFPAALFHALGWKGSQLLEELLLQAREENLFTLVDVPISGAERWLAPPFSADCLIVNGYPGGAALPALLEACRERDKCLLLLARAQEGGELQDLVAGDRLVYQVVGDQAHRLNGGQTGKFGYGRVGIAAQGVYPSDLRKLRIRWEQDFLLVSGPAEDARFAFDKYGRGALVDMVPTAPENIPAAIDKLQQELKKFITIL